MWTKIVIGLSIAVFLLMSVVNCTYGPYFVEEHQRLPLQKCPSGGYSKIRCRPDIKFNDCGRGFQCIQNRYLYQYDKVFCGVCCPALQLCPKGLLQGPKCSYGTKCPRGFKCINGVCCQTTQFACPTGSIPGRKCSMNFPCNPGSICVKGTCCSMPQHRQVCPSNYFPLAGVKCGLHSHCPGSSVCFDYKCCHPEKPESKTPVLRQTVPNEQPPISPPVNLPPKKLPSYPVQEVPKTNPPVIISPPTKPQTPPSTKNPPAVLIQRPLTPNDEPSFVRITSCPLGLHEIPGLTCDHILGCPGHSQCISGLCCTKEVNSVLTCPAEYTPIPDINCGLRQHCPTGSRCVSGICCRPPSPPGVPSCPRNYTRVPDLKCDFGTCPGNDVCVSGICCTRKRKIDLGVQPPICPNGYIPAGNIQCRSDAGCPSDSLCIAGHCCRFVIDPTKVPATREFFIPPTQKPTQTPIRKVRIQSTTVQTTADMTRSPKGVSKTTPVPFIPTSLSIVPFIPFIPTFSPKLPPVLKTTTKPAYDVSFPPYVVPPIKNQSPTVPTNQPIYPAVTSFIPSLPTFAPSNPISSEPPFIPVSGPSVTYKPADAPTERPLIPSQPHFIPTFQPQIPSKPPSVPTVKPSVPSEPPFIPTSKPIFPSLPPFVPSFPPSVTTSPPFIHTVPHSVPTANPSIPFVSPQSPVNPLPHQSQPPVLPPFIVTTHPGRAVMPPVPQNSPTTNVPWLPTYSTPAPFPDTNKTYHPPDLIPRLPSTVFPPIFEPAFPEVTFPPTVPNHMPPIIPNTSKQPVTESSTNPPTFPPTVPFSMPPIVPNVTPIIPVSPYSPIQSTFPATNPNVPSRAPLPFSIPSSPKTPNWFDPFNFTLPYTTTKAAVPTVKNINKTSKPTTPIPNPPTTPYFPSPPSSIKPPLQTIPLSKFTIPSRLPPSVTLTSTVKYPVINVSTFIPLTFKSSTFIPTTFNYNITPPPILPPSSLRPYPGTFKPVNITIPPYPLPPGFNISTSYPYWDIMTTTKLTPNTTNHKYVSNNSTTATRQVFNQTSPVTYTSLVPTEQPYINATNITQSTVNITSIPWTTTIAPLIPTDILTKSTPTPVTTQPSRPPIPSIESICPPGNVSIRALTCDQSRKCPAGSQCFFGICCLSVDTVQVSACPDYMNKIPCPQTRAPDECTIDKDCGPEMLCCLNKCGTRICLPPRWNPKPSIPRK